LLPAIYSHEKSGHIHYLPKIIVKTTEEKEYVTQLIDTQSTKWYDQCQNKYIKGYYKQLSRVKIIALQDLSTSADNNSQKWVVVV
jgi:hypothetical protein